MDPDHRYYGMMDMSNGYHQIEIPEGDRDLFAIILPQGKYTPTTRLNATLVNKGQNNSQKWALEAILYIFLVYIGLTLVLAPPPSRSSVLGCPPPSASMTAWSLAGMDLARAVLKFLSHPAP